MKNSESLASPDWRERKAAIEGIAQGKLKQPDLLAIIREEHQDLNRLNAALQLITAEDQHLVPGLAELLGHAQPEVRLFAVQALRQIGNRHAGDTLLGALADEDTNVLFAVIESLGALHVKEAALPLIDFLYHPNAYLVFAAIEACGRIGDPAPAARLIELLSEDWVAQEAALALGNLGYLGVVLPLGTWMKKEAQNLETGIRALVALSQRAAAEGHWDVMTEREIVRSLGEIGQQKILDLTAQFGSRRQTEADNPFFADLAVVLGWMAGSGSQAALHGLAALLSLPVARPTVLQILHGCGKDAAPALRAVLWGEDLEVRKAAAKLLAALQDDASLGDYLGLLEEADPELVVYGARGLAGLEQAPAVDALAGLLAHAAAVVREEALEALAGTDRLVHLSAAWLQSEQPLQREMALRAMGKSGAGAISETVRAGTADPEAAVRAAAFEVLAAHHSEMDEAVFSEVFAGGLRDPQKQVRDRVVRSLAEIPAQQALPLLYHALTDPDYWIRLHACQSIGGFGEVESLGALAEAMHDPMPPVRMEALKAISRINTEEASRMLIRGLGDPNADVRRIVQEALEG